MTIGDFSAFVPTGVRAPTTTDPVRELIARAVVEIPPAALTDPVHVRLKNFTSAYTYEVPPYAWEPHHDALGAFVFPAVGDVCAVVFDDDGDAWIAQWGTP